MDRVMPLVFQDELRLSYMLGCFGRMSYFAMGTFPLMMNLPCNDEPLFESS